jgi:hypothetical protein
VDVVTAAVMDQVRSICEKYLDVYRFETMARKMLEEMGSQNDAETAKRHLEDKIETLSAKMDRMYMDKLAGILGESDFARLYMRAKEERLSLEEKKRALQTEEIVPGAIQAQARQLTERFLDTYDNNKELLANLIEKVELTENKEIYIHFRFRQMET